MRWLNVLVVLTTPVVAWHASHVSESDLVTGTQLLNISVGCGSTHAYPPIPTRLNPKKPAFSTVIANPLAEFISLHFTSFALPGTDYIVIRPTNRQDKRLPLTYHGKNQSSAFYSQAMTTDSITLELYSHGATDTTNKHCHGFTIDKYRFLASAASVTGSVEEAVCGEDQSEEARCFQDYPPVFNASNAVARLLIHKDNSSFFCTGWLVGCQGHVITNHHCISNATHAENTEFEFLAEGQTCSDACNVPFGCLGVTRATTSTLVIANPDLDYAMVQIDGDLWKEYGYLQLRDGGAKLNEQVYIPQHPAGWGKRIAMKDDGGGFGTVVALDRNGCLPEQVAYNLDTQGGSSGSPVLSSVDNAVVALHHCGGCPNTAVNIDKIIKDLQDKNLLPDCAIYQPSSSR